jgi:phospholipase C
MKKSYARALALTVLLAAAPLLPRAAHADGNLNNVNHVIILMQENHSFDNYFGALPYAPGSPYHEGKKGACAAGDHACVDGLSCERNPHGKYVCHNSNRDDGHGKKIFAFHSNDYCVKTDLDHSWFGVHHEINFNDPNGGLAASPMDGFVLQNDSSNQVDGAVGVPADDETMSFYNEGDIGFYYALAESFGISDRYFAAVPGPTFPNRSYLMAATSFGHLTTNEEVPDINTAPFVFYKPITGTIFDFFDHNGVSWADYSDDIPQGTSFRNFLADPVHFRGFSGMGPAPFYNNPFNSFLQDAAAGTLPEVALVDPNFGFYMPENDEHPGPGGDIRKGQSFVAQALDAVRNGPNWKDSIVFITYDEHGGYYDHATPPPAPQGGALNPDGINPGQCADLSNPLSSEQPNGGLNCKESNCDAASICLAFTPTGAYPAACANFNQLGVRVPLTAVSPFSKPHYVSHTVGDHTSLIALIEKRFLSGGGSPLHLTARDANANTLEDLFNFDTSPSLSAALPSPPPTFSPTDPGCGP